MIAASSCGLLAARQIAPALEPDPVDLVAIENTPSARRLGRARRHDPASHA